MSISVLLPSRGRPQSLVDSIGSLRKLADHPGCLEILVGADPDDALTMMSAQACGTVAVWFPERYGYHQLHQYVNALAKRARGDWLLLWNDDARMQTEGWDSAITSYDPTAPLVLSLASTGYDHALCCFPAVSRDLYEQLGHLSLSPHIDTWLQDLGRATGILRDILVHVYHDRHDLTGGHNDQTRAESQAGYRRDEFYGDAMQALLRADIDKVRV